MELKKFEEMLDKFFMETPPEELKKILNKYDDMEFEGPTISEYFRSMDRINIYQQLQNDIKKWSDETFGKHRTGKPIAYHLKKEIDELINSLDDFHKGVYSDNVTVGALQVVNKRIRIKAEAVDCFILLLDILAHEGFDTHDLLHASLEKLEINKKRKWGKPDENGVVEHIKE